MKKIIIPLIFTLFFNSNSIQAQKATLDKSVIQDFIANFFYQYKYRNNQNLKAWAYLTGRKLGYGQVDTEIAVEQMESNIKFRDELLRTFVGFSGSNKEHLIMNFISIGMQATNAKKLGTYILQHYKVDQTISNKRKESNKEEAVQYGTVDKEAQSGQKQPKAMFKKSLFSGTKFFCDSLQYWSYQITILQETITLTLYAGKNNTNYKDKSKPVEVIKGTIKGGLIVTKDAPEYLVNRFKYENGVLYEVNNEGGFNDYKECTAMGRK